MDLFRVILFWLNVFYAGFKFSDLFVVSGIWYFLYRFLLVESDGRIGRSRRNSIWKAQKIVTNRNNLTAKCISCNKIIKTSGGSTSGLHTHLKTAHSIVLKHNIDANSRHQLATSSAANTSFLPLLRKMKHQKKGTNKLIILQVQIAY